MTPVERLEKKYQKEDDLNIRNGLNKLLSTYEGRCFMRWLLQITGFSQDPFTNNALSSAYNNGQQAIAIALFDLMMTQDPHSYGRLIQELQEVTNSRAAELANKENDYEV